MWSARDLEEKEKERTRAKGERTVSSSVIRSLKDDDVVLSGSSSSNLDGSLNGLGSRVPEEEGVEVRGGHAVKETVDC